MPIKLYLGKLVGGGVGHSIPKVICLPVSMAQHCAPYRLSSSVASVSLVSTETLPSCLLYCSFPQLKGPGLATHWACLLPRSRLHPPVALALPPILGRSLSFVGEGNCGPLSLVPGRQLSGETTQGGALGRPDALRALQGGDCRLCNHPTPPPPTHTHTLPQTQISAKIGKDQTLGSGYGKGQCWRRVEEGTVHLPRLN